MIRVSVGIKHFLLFYCDLITCTTPACFSTVYRCAMVPTLVENLIFCVLVVTDFIGASTQMDLFLRELFTLIIEAWS